MSSIYNSAVNLAAQLPLLVATAKREEAEWWNTQLHSKHRDKWLQGFRQVEARRLAGLRAEEAKLGGGK